MINEFMNTDVCLSFWGVKVGVKCVPADAKDLSFFYGSYIVAETGPQDVYVTLECKTWPARGFFKSSLSRDHLEKRIAICDALDPSRSTERTFRDWSNLVSPFPPFSCASLAPRIATFPGVVVRSEDGNVIAIIGEIYVGKTSIAVALCRLYGARLISDNLIVVDVQSGLCLTFETPLGFRRKSLEELIPRLDHLDYRLTVSSDTGLVALVRTKDVLGVNNAAGGRIDSLVVVNQVDSPSPACLRVNPRRLGWFTEASQRSIDSLLPDYFLQVDLPVKMPPSLRAQFIAHAIREKNHD